MDEVYDKQHWKSVPTWTNISHKMDERMDDNERQRKSVSNGMNIESNRIRSFKTSSWPVTFESLIYRLANAGFYFTGIDDEVKCFSCGIAFRDWQREDSPKGRHKSGNPKCRYVKGIDARNIRDVNYVLSPNKSNVISSRHTANKSRKLGASFEENDCSMMTEYKNGKEDFMTFSKGYHNESNRLNTFKEFPLTCPVDPYELSASGFFLAGKSTVQCFACFLRIRNSNWKIGDRPMNKHRMLSPSCPYVKGLETRNRPLTKAERVKALGDDIHQKPTFERRVKTQHPRFNSQEARFASFKSWAYSKIVKPSELVDAGFFYSNQADLVTCFCCGCRLEDWKIGDVPWKEHQLWSPDCVWLNEQQSAFV